jgi:hypothetical protein
VSASTMARCAAFLSALACSLTAPLGAVAAPAAAPPDNTYAFSVARNGQKVGASTLTVKRVGASIAIHEIETFTGVTDTVDEALDPETLLPGSYTSSFPLTAEVGITAHLAFYSGGARETVDGTTGETDFKLESGTSHLVVIDGAMMSGFFFLPAQIKALSLTAFTALAPSRADTYDCQLDATASTTRPPAVPQADVSVTVDGTSPTGNVQFVEWYDPRSMIVDEVDVPANQVTIALTRGTH